MSALQIVPVETAEQLALVRDLFVEYARSLSFHICFDDFQKELDQLPGVYSPPAGRLFVALANGKAIGCVALKKISEGVGEIKRLYVRPSGRGQGTGRRLAETILETSRQLGYRTIRLDTLPSMTGAQSLYRSLGFKPIASDHPTGQDDEPIDMELSLR